MGFMRIPRGMFMRGMRPPPGGYMPEEEEDTEMTEEKKDDDISDENGSGPKPLMSIRTPKEIKETVKTSILSHGPQMMAPLGMGMGPRYHAMRGGIRPPPGGPPGGPPPPSEGGPPPHAQSPTSSGPPPRYPSTRGHHAPRGGKPDHYNPVRTGLKRPAPHSTSHHEGGPRPSKMMATTFTTITPAPGTGSSRSNLRQIQMVDEPMQQVNRKPPQALHHQHQQPPYPHHTVQKSHQSSYGGFRVAHKPAPSITQIRTVDSSGGSGGSTQPPQASQRRLPPQQSGAGANSNLRSIQTIQGGAYAPGGSGAQPRITKTGGSSSRVLITHLPPNMSFARITAMTTACGNVKNLNVKSDNNSAIVEFANPAGAENFIRSNNRKVIDQCMITVSRLA